MQNGRHYDVVIIGSGAGGGTLLRSLAESGKRILLLERGGFVTREKQNWDDRAVWVRHRYWARETWYDARGRSFRPQLYCCIGGKTKMYGAALFRLRKEDFGEVRHHGGISPAWPISYSDMEPYYTRAEQLYQVHGARGGDPTEAEASAPFPFPPISNEPCVQELWEGLSAAGCRPFSLPVGVMLDERTPHLSRCIRCSTCDGYPCLLDAKADADVAGVRPALQYPNVTLLTGAEVTRLNTGPSGREVVEILVNRDGAIESYSGDIVVLSAGAVNSVRVLLASGNERHPHGLANGSGQLGRNLMRHNMAVFVAFSSRPNPTHFQKTLAINDFYFGMEGFPFPAGNIQMLGKSSGAVYRSVVPLAPYFILDRVARHAFEFLAISEDLPDPNNRVTLAADGRPQLAFRPNNLEPIRRLVAKLKSLLRQVGLPSGPLSLFSSVHHLPLARLGHLNGTCRMGTDPGTSVLDANCKAHELDNLYVVDASVFPSSGAVNPSLTIMANALRVGDHIRARLKS
jgi:choline dehydrogenase-like flavoprotein